MRITYLILVFLTQVILMVVVVLAPIYITPGWYYWSVGFGIVFFASSYALGQRINEWNRMDLLKNNSK